MQLIALKKLKYAGRHYLPDDHFDAKPREAMVLTALRMAREREPETIQPTLQVAAVVAEADEAVPVVRRRRYKRRDMRPEE